MKEATENYLDFIAEVLACEPEAVPEESTLLGDVSGWDSLKHVRLIVGLEDTLGVELAPEEIEGIKTVGDVKDVLDRHSR